MLWSILSKALLNSVGSYDRMIDMLNSCSWLLSFSSLISWAFIYCHTCVFELVEFYVKNRSQQLIAPKMIWIKSNCRQVFYPSYLLVQLVRAFRSLWLYKQILYYANLVLNSRTITWKTQVLFSLITVAFHSAIFFYELIKISEYDYV